MESMVLATPIVRIFASSRSATTIRRCEVEAEAAVETCDRASAGSWLARRYEWRPRKLVSHEMGLFVGVRCGMFEG